MNKKTTARDVATMFPKSAIREEDNGFSLPLVLGRGNELSFWVPDELLEGPGGIAMLEGGFQASNDPEVRAPFQTEYSVQVATGHLDGNMFYFGAPMDTRQVAVAVRWEMEPPDWALRGLESYFAKEYQAIWLERIAPLEKEWMAKVLQQIPPKMEAPIMATTGYDFWVLKRTDFYCKTCELRSQEVSRMVQMRHAEADREACRKLMGGIAAEIAGDSRLPGWKLICGDDKAHLTAVDRYGKVQATDIPYMATFLRGLNERVELGRSGTLVFPGP